MRFKDSPDLFGCGIGTSTCAEIRCDFCGTLYNEGADPDGEKGPSSEGEWIPNITFAGKTICECCFEKIENEIYGRMNDIISWYRDITKVQRKELEQREKLLSF